MDGTQAELYPNTDSKRLRVGASARAKGSFLMISHPQASINTNKGKIAFIFRRGIATPQSVQERARILPGPPCRRFCAVVDKITHFTSLAAIESLPEFGVSKGEGKTCQCGAVGPCEMCW